MSKSRDAIAKATFEVVATRLVLALEEGTKVWPPTRSANDGSGFSTAQSRTGSRSDCTRLVDAPC